MLPNNNSVGMDTYGEDNLKIYLERDREASHGWTISGEI